MIKKHHIVISVIVIIILYILHSQSYPIISKGVKSKNYKIEKISNETCSDILYDAANNYFLLLFEDVVIKLDSKGNEAYRITMEDYYYLSGTSHYVLSSSGLYDLSKDSAVFEKFSEILNADFSFETSKLSDLFNQLYDSACIVTYDNHNYDGVGTDKAYFKIKDKWVLLYVDDLSAEWGLLTPSYKDEKGHVIYDRFGMPIFTINDRLEKSNRLLLLKDTKRGEYSDRTTTDDSELYPNYCARFPFPNDYLKSNRMELGYSNIKVGETFPYTPIPIMFRTTAYYRLKIEKDVLKFKCLTYKGCKGISGSAGMYWFRLPIKYKDASKVSFIRVSEWSNAFNERKFVGHYVIKTID